MRRFAIDSVSIGDHRDTTSIVGNTFTLRGHILIESKVVSRSHGKSVTEVVAFDCDHLTLCADPKHAIAPLASKIHDPIKRAHNFFGDARDGLTLLARESFFWSAAFSGTPLSVLADI